MNHCCLLRSSSLLVQNISAPCRSSQYRVPGISPLNKNYATPSTMFTNTPTVHSEYIPSSTDEEENTKVALAKASTMRLIYLDPLTYLGILSIGISLLDLLAAKCQVPVLNILITLRKIRLNETFKVLGDHFDLSRQVVGKIFNTSVKLMAREMNHFISFSSSYGLLMNMPPAFRLRYNNVRSIIDCFEVEIQKPKKATKQARSWSSYKNGNTVKFLISIEPDGKINYVSLGFGGKTSDIRIIKKSKFLKKLKAGWAVMADRGFKGIEKELNNINCTLIRPPSAVSDKQMTEKEVSETKKIASLRIHVERTIRRVREFKILKQHSVIEHNLVNSVNDIVKIVCGLVNLQSGIIKST